MRWSRASALAICASVVIGLASCGGDDDDSDEAETPQTATQQETAPAEEPTDTSTAGDGELTPPGTELSPGESAPVGWQPPSLISPTGEAEVINVEATVVSLEKRSLSDLEGIDLDADQRESTPYFLKVRVRNLGRTAPPEDEPDLSFNAFDDRGQEQGSVTFIGDFPPCEDESPPKPFRRGESFESCLTFLVPGGGSIEEIRWNDGPAGPNGVSEYFEKPVVWKAG